MAKPTPDENTSAAAPAPAVQAVPGGAEAAAIRAKPGEPWPDPPAGGSWVRNARTGDLTCVEAATQTADPGERHARRVKQREAALADANKTNSKE